MNSVTKAGPGPTAAHLAQCKRDGFFVARRLIPTGEVDEIRAAFMELNANGPIPGLSEIDPEHGTYAADDPLSFYPRMMMPHLHPELAVGPLARK